MDGKTKKHSLKKKSYSADSRAKSIFPTLSIVGDVIYDVGVGFLKKFHNLFLLLL